jgi:tetratricopeptide (TPR) repeat protein
MNPENDISQARFETIEAFLSGNMQASERTEFAKNLKTDPGLEADYLRLRDLMMAAEEAGLRDDMESIHQTLIKPPKYNFLWLPMAAVLLILIAGAGWWLFSSEQELSPEGALFAQYAYPDPGLPVPMSASAANAYNFYDAMVDYKTEDYSVAAQKWREIARSSPDNDTLDYYIGSAEFNIGDYDDAASQFERVLASGTSAFTDKARLYLTLSLLQTGDTGRIFSIEVPDDAAYADTLRTIKRQIRHR